MSLLSGVLGRFWMRHQIPLVPHWHQGLEASKTMGANLSGPGPYVHEHMSMFHDAGSQNALSLTGAGEQGTWEKRTILPTCPPVAYFCLLNLSLRHSQFLGPGEPVSKLCFLQCLHNMISPTLSLSTDVSILPFPELHVCCQ